MTLASIVAIKRFGLGARPGELAAIGSDPRGAVLAQLANPAALAISSQPPANAPHPTSRDAWLAARRFQIEVNIAANAIKIAAPAQTPPPTLAVATTAPGAPKPPAPVRPPDKANTIFQSEVEDRFRRAVSSSTPFLERLVWFWSNHFCVAVNKDQQIRAVAGAYEREVIRPHVLGRFRDMLGGVVRHSAMQAYLDNTRSVGPNSLIGRWRQRGLNENLARELLELHTLGVDGGYDQGDVTRLAHILTGWTVTDMESSDPGATIFMAEAHEPGAIDVLGKTYPEPGRGQLDQVLDDLARHPSTARFVARKLAGHFVGPNASQQLIDLMAETYKRTDGNLGDVAKVMISHDDAWAAGPTRTIPPWDYTVAVGRAMEIDLPIPMVNRILDLLGQRTWEVQSPKGWQDDEDWSGTAALIERLDWADDIGRRFAAQKDIPALAQSLFGPALSTDTAAAIRRAESRQQAVALLLMSPEFQRR